LTLEASVKGRGARAGLAREGAAPEVRLDAMRVLDMSIALVALVVVLPVLLLIAVLVKAQDGGPVLFAQTRIGRNGRRFRCYKIRTMVVDAQARLDAVLASDPAARREWERDHKLRNDPRITGLGRILRESSLDELPQLFNVLNGEMSIVGPRPIVEAEVARYGRFFRHYCSVPPGITGLWQVSGRNDVEYRERVALDILYARSRCLKRNLTIMLMTVPAVLLRKGSY
jgi:lipopolysaccharide/colanic/teichoic acid biosynthesis glycosyltransferase